MSEIYFMDHGQTCEPCPCCGKTLEWRWRAGDTWALVCPTRGCRQPERNAGRKDRENSAHVWALTPDARVWD